MSFSLWSASSLQNHCGPPPWDLFSFLFHLLTCQCLPLDIRKLHWSQQRRLVLILDLCGYNFEKCCSTSRIKRVMYFGELARCFGKQSGPVIKSVALWTAWFSPLCPAWHDDIWCGEAVSPSACLFLPRCCSTLICCFRKQNFPWEVTVNTQMPFPVLELEFCTESWHDLQWASVGTRVTCAVDSSETQQWKSLYQLFVFFRFIFRESV